MRVWAIITVVLAVVLLALGGFVTSFRVGMADPVWPTVPWYRLPKLYRENREVLIRENGGLLYNGYADVFRRFFLRRHDVPVHPLGRAPEKPQAGKG